MRARLHVADADAKKVADAADKLKQEQQKAASAKADKLAQEKLYLEEEIRGEMNFDQIVGSSPALSRVLELVETVAPSDSTVLLLGETGTGKDETANRQVPGRPSSRSRPPDS